METAHQFEHVDGEIIDLVTGEVMPADPLTGDLLDIEKITVEDLPKMGRWLASVDRKLAHLREAVDGCHCEYCNLRREVARLEVYAIAKAMKLSDQRAVFLTHAQNLVTATGQKSIKYPGIGRFGWRAGMERVNDQVYQDLPDDLRRPVIDSHPELFRIKVEPDKPKIKAALKANADLQIPFSLERGDDTFEFRGEL